MPCLTKSRWVPNTKCIYGPRWNSDEHEDLTVVDNIWWTTSGGCIECPEYNRTPANTALTRKLPQLTCNQSRWPCIFSQQQVGIPVTWWDPVPRVKPLSDTRHTFAGLFVNELQYNTPCSLSTRMLMVMLMKFLLVVVQYSHSSQECSSIIISSLCSTLHPELMTRKLLLLLHY